ncbi:MAG: tyrosine-type recombinase/integrase [Spirochaetaceae bacterium]|nr:tyrosine-type recombinase/integrase [Myxococcales bacterium]MCB9722766.1 tyrosine-type recombinase/integrase [Spirochaetaceae bacterium]
MAAEVSPFSTPSSTPSSNPSSPVALSAAPNAAAHPDGDAFPSEPTRSELLSEPPHRVSPQDDVDFLLHPAELAKGRCAAENYLSSFKSEDSRRIAEEALETLATVISGGKCDSVEFPWQQVRPYHGAAALTILKERGAPARIEALRCRKDSTRNYRVVPETYPTREVQKIRTTLTKVIEECCELGLIGDEDRDATLTAAASTAKGAGASNGRKARGRTSRKAATARSAPRNNRLLADGEVRALMAAAATDGGAEGARDAVLFAFAYLGLKIAEITALSLESVQFSNKSGVCTIVVRPRSGGRARRVELSNDELICLEDWLDLRGNAPGPLLCTVGRNGQIEGKRLTLAMLTEIFEKRAQQAEVTPFTPNDLSRSAEALVDHRKASRRRAARRAQDQLSEAEQLLFEGQIEPDGEGEAIRFPFLGLNI